MDRQPSKLIVEAMYNELKQELGAQNIDMLFPNAQVADSVMMEEETNVQFEGTECLSSNEAMGELLKNKEVILVGPKEISKLERVLTMLNMEFSVLRNSKSGKAKFVILEELVELELI